MSFLRERIVTQASDRVVSGAFCWVPEGAAGTSASAGGFSNGTGLIKFLVYANMALRQTCYLGLQRSWDRVPVLWRGAQRCSAIIMEQILTICISYGWILLMTEPVQIAVVVSGYVGLVAAVCFAEMGHSVICVDNDERKVASLQGGDTLIHEEHLPELLQRYRNTRVRFMTDLGEATRRCQAIFVAVGTPQSETGDADLSYVEAVASEIARSINGYKVIIEKSTVPVYTKEWIRRVIERNGVSRDAFDVVSNPEFLREGTAVEDFLHPDRIVVGADSLRAAALLSQIYAPLVTGAYYEKAEAIEGDCSMQSPPPLLMTSTKSAEIIKHA